MNFQKNKRRVFRDYEKLIKKKNKSTEFYNGVFQRYENPVLTSKHIPPFWKYDLNPETNPYFMERLGVNAVFNSGAIFWQGKYYLMARVEGCDRKSFFAIAESDSPIEGFRFHKKPIIIDDIYPEETNVYDIRLTKHQDGYIYGVFCSERKDSDSSSLSDAIASAGIIRTKDMVNWERLPNLVTKSLQQRNVTLHPEFVDGKYAFYTRPTDTFISAGSAGGICFGLCDDINNPSISNEVLISERRYHTITEEKNGEGAVVIKTEKGWIHIAHGVRNTAAGLRYVIYLYVTDLENLQKVIAEPGGYLIAPEGEERVGDVSNVVFTNGAIEDGENIYIYYASSDTRLHVASTTKSRLLDYAFNTPSDAIRSCDCVEQRIELIDKNLELL